METYFDLMKIPCSSSHESVLEKLAAEDLILKGKRYVLFSFFIL